MNENEIGTLIIETAIDLHKELGPGLYENVYETILAKRLYEKGLSVQRQVKIPIEFEDNCFADGFRADLVINGKVIIELKSTTKIMDIHKKKLLTYLKLTKLKLGYILNFGEVKLKDGIVRVVNKLAEDAENR